MQANQTNTLVEMLVIIGEGDKVRFNNALQAMEKTGQIKRVGKKQTGKQGRQPSVFILVPEVKNYVL